MLKPALRLLLGLAAVGAAAFAWIHLHQLQKDEPVVRFADRRWRQELETNLTRSAKVDEYETGDIRTTDFPFLSLEDEVMYTMTRRIRAPLLFSEGMGVPSDHQLPLIFQVPEGFVAGDRVALETEWELEGIWRSLDPHIATVETLDGRDVIRFVADLPDDAAGLVVGVNIEGTVVARENPVHHRTAEVAVPERASLEFAMGVEPSARNQGKVLFAVSICEGSGCRIVYRETLDPLREDRRGWQHRRIDLGAESGKKVSFVFESTLLSDDPDAFSAARWGNPTIYARRAPEKDRPNVILVSLDTLSAKHIPTYGSRQDTAPFVDRVLATEGLVFDHAVAAATTTPQSHMSMLTSVQPCEHGILTGLEVVRPELVTLAESLRAAGYETGAVTEDGWLGFEHGFGRGFNSYAENKSADIMLPTGQLDVTLAKARAWIDRNADKPYFLFLHSFQVHDPYSPAAKFSEMFRDREDGHVGPDSPKARQDVVSYEQEIRYSDELLENFFRDLQQRGALEDTVVIFTSDHGEEFFEHGAWGHGAHFYEEVTHVPLIFWGPGRIPAGRRVSDTVGHIDLMPTILALAGVEAPPQVRGRDLLAKADAAQADDAKRVASTRFGETHVESLIDENYEKVDVLPPAYLVQRGALKVARYRSADGLRYEAYDLDRDPAEKDNLFGKGDPRFEPLKELVDGYEGLCRKDPAARLELDPEREQKLKALGYLN